MTQKVMKQVIVHWDDAGAWAHTMTPEEAQDIGIYNAVTMGFICEEDDKEIKVVQTLYNRNGNLECMKHIKPIPKVSIMYIEEVERKKIVYRHP